MKSSKSVSLVFVVTIFVFGASSASAQEWKSITDCTPHGDNMKCGLTGAIAGQSARITIQNLKPAEAKIDWFEFHSACGWPGGNVQSDNDLTLPGNGTVTYRVLDPGYGVTCREVFLSCKYLGSTFKCSDVIRARMQSFVGNRQ